MGLNIRLGSRFRLYWVRKNTTIIFIHLMWNTVFGRDTFEFLLFRICYFETDNKRFDLRFISAGIQRVSDSRWCIFSSFSLLKTTSEHKSNTLKHPSGDDNKKIVFYEPHNCAYSENNLFMPRQIFLCHDLKCKWNISSDFTQFGHWIFIILYCLFIYILMFVSVVFFFTSLPKRIYHWIN